MNLQLSYRTVSKYKWFVWHNHRPGLLQVMFSVEFGLVMDTRIIEILWHKSILLQWLKNLVTCLIFDDIFFLYKLHIFYSKNIEHWEYISCFTMHVELFLQFNAKAHDIKWKLGPLCNKSNLNLSPPILALFLLYTPSPPLIWFFSPPPDNYCTVPTLTSHFPSLLRRAA